MDWISLGGRGPRPSLLQTPPHPAIYEGPPPLKLPMDRISPHHGVCCGALLAGAFSFSFLRVLAQKMSYFVKNVISGPDLLTNDDIWSDFILQSTSKYETYAPAWPGALPRAKSSIDQMRFRQISRKRNRS